MSKTPYFCYSMKPDLAGRPYAQFAVKLAFPVDDLVSRRFALVVSILTSRLALSGRSYAFLDRCTEHADWKL